MELIDKIIYAFLCAVPALFVSFVIVPSLVIKTKKVTVDETWTTASPNSEEIGVATHIETINWRD